ncbi:unnamed protein product [Nezara viridula]|uniref:Uncharacterized protein n=1 Tax=Nezara viridula TaxID=85310 RepID=A0A9P0HN45_NEZVI|nr:unnamed protein product [Nezara viridula]
MENEAIPSMILTEPYQIRDSRDALGVRSWMMATGYDWRKLAKPIITNPPPSTPTHPPPHTNTPSNNNTPPHQNTYSHSPAPTPIPPTQKQNPTHPTSHTLTLKTTIPTPPPKPYSTSATNLPKKKYFPPQPLPPPRLTKKTTKQNPTSDLAHHAKSTPTHTTSLPQPITNTHLSDTNT